MSLIEAQQLQPAQQQTIWNRQVWISCPKPNLKGHFGRKDTLEQNLTKAYAPIFSTYYNKTMQNQIEECRKFESRIRDDPIELLNKIKVLMHNSVRTKYRFSNQSDQ
jgi:hypothetical protein